MAPPFIYHCAQDDIPFLPFLKGIIGGRANVRVNSTRPDMGTELLIAAKQHGCTRVATTSDKLLSLLLDSKKEESVSNYAGSIIERYGLEFLILDPLSSVVSVPYGKFLYNRFLGKFLDESRWMPIPAFSWSVFDPAKKNDLLHLFSGASFIGCDIETGLEEDRVITCISFAAVHFEHGSKCFRVTTIVVPFDDEYNVAFASTVLRLPVFKVFQNGKYDNAYLLRYGIATNNWGGDTINLFHSWYSELPKDLGFIAAFTLRRWQYWKDLGKNYSFPDPKYLEYNARDSFGTAMAWFAMLLEVPDWALQNYQKEFPLVFPCLLAEMTGIKADREQLRVMKAATEKNYAARLLKLQAMVACPQFNPRSPPQTVALFTILGSGDIKSSGKIPMDKVMARHPLNKRILGDIKKYREERKLDSTYLDEDKIWCGRWFFSLNPHGTDTSRLASKESQFWCGLQIQNIPRDRKDIQIKSQFLADKDFLFGEADYKQNETYGTAFLSGDPALLEAILDPSKDFHGRNAADFFGVPYDEIVASKFVEELNEWVHEVLNKDVRQISKNTNHGSNYNMGAQVLIDTMGIENVIRAKRLLKLPQAWSLIQVTNHLLAQFTRKYHILKGPWYEKCKSDVRGSHMLVSPNGWVRYCFGDPDKNKRHLNSYVAHPPQCEAAQRLNLGYKKVFYNVWMPNTNNFKLGPQIHDSILFQYRKGHEYLAWQVAEQLVMPTEVTDTFGTKRVMTVPVDLKGNAERWSEVKTLRRRNDS